MEELSPPVKDAFQAEVFRRRGNKSYKDRDLKEALKLYNKVRAQERTFLWRHISIY